MLLLCPQVSSSGAREGRTSVTTVGKMPPAPSWGGPLAPAQIYSLRAQIYPWLDPSEPEHWESSGCCPSLAGKRLLSHPGGSKDLLSPLFNPHWDFLWKYSRFLHPEPDTRGYLGSEQRVGF